MRPKKRLIKAIVLCMPVLFATSVQAEQVLGTQEGVTILLPDDFTCSESVRLKLTADSPAPFADDALMVRVAGQLSALMAFDCPEAKNIMMEGAVGAEPVYNAVTSERSNWSVMTRLAPDAAAASETAGTALEGQPPVAGLLPALPETSAGETTATAAPSLPTLPEAGESAASESSAAVERLAGIGSTSARDSDNFCDAGSFNTAPFARARELSLLFDGDFEALEELDQRFLTIYLVNLNNNFGKVAVFDPACSRFYNPDLAPDVIDDFMGQTLGSPDATMQTGAEILNLLGQLSTNPGSFMGQVADVERAMNAAEADVNRLRQANACTNPGFRRLYENLVSYLGNDDPVCASGWPGVKIACADHARSNGSTAGEAREFCGCVTEALRSSGALRELAESIRLTYDPATSLEPLLAADAAVRKQVGLCLLR